MTITLAPDDRPTPRVATLASRHGTGRVVYPAAFRELARPVVARNPGTPRTVLAREAAREPVSPLSSWDSWYERNEGWLSIVLGIVGLALVAYVGACFALAIAHRIVS